MSRKRCTDVLIVGAGPVGMVAALRLVQHGVDVLIVDERDSTTQNSFALALHPGSLRILDELGLADELIAEGLPIERIRLLDRDVDEPRVTLDCSHLPGRFPFVLVLAQELLEKTLDRQLRRYGTRVRRGCRATAMIAEPDAVVTDLAQLDKAPWGVRLDRSDWIVRSQVRMHSRYVIGADGCHSFVRDELGSGFRRVGPSQTYAVFEFDTSYELDRDCRIVVRDDDVSVLWPMGAHCGRWSFEIDASEARRTEVPGGAFVLGSRVLGYFNDRLDHRAPWFPRVERKIRWSPVPCFDRRLAEPFGRGRVWLAGDAAHQTSPVGAQSLNGGLVDASLLADRILERLGGGGSPLSLESYGEERTAEWRRLLGMDEVAWSPKADAWVRANAGSILPSIPATGDDLRLLLGQAGLQVGGPAQTGFAC